MREADSFVDAAFLGLARRSRRDPYRLSLFAEHLDTDERPLAVLPIQAGTLIVTDRRLLEVRAHLEVHGAWNVQEFRGYTIHQEIERREILGLASRTVPSQDALGVRRVEDSLVVTTPSGAREFLVSRGPEPVLTEDDFALLRTAIVGPQLM